MLELGNSLREARRTLGLELNEVEAATLIRARYLDALEQEQFDVLPPGSYRRTFLREYADFLGLDGNVFAEEYTLRSAPPGPEPGQPDPAERPRLVAASALLDRFSPRLALAALVVILAGIGIWRLSEGGSSEVHTPPRADATPPSHHRTKPAKTTPATPPTTTTTIATPAGPPPALTLTAARGSCWLLVRSGSSTGPVVVERTLQPGEVVSFGLRRPLWIRLGAPANLDATIGKKPVSGLPQTTADVVATRSGIRAAP